MLKIGWLSLLGLLLFLMLLNLAAYQLLPRLRFKHIVIHHTASSEENYQSIKDYHAKRHGWQDAAYHLILSNGSTRVPLGYLEATGRYRSLSYSLATRSRYYNLTGLHLCVVGNYSETSMPAELRGPLAHALAVLQQRFHISDGQILFHRDCNDTQCPGLNLSKAQVLNWLGSLADSCPEAIKQQHRRIVGGAGFQFWNQPGWVWAVWIALNLVGILAWLGLICLIRLLTGLFTRPFLERHDASNRTGDNTAPAAKRV
jgi:hypothetical protein